MTIRYKLSYPPSKPSKDESGDDIIITNSNIDTVWFQTNRQSGRRSFLFLKGKAILKNDILICDFDNYGLSALFISIVLAINGINFLNDGEWINGLWVSLPVLVVSFFIYKVMLRSLIERNLGVLYHTIKGNCS